MGVVLRQGVVSMDEIIGRIRARVADGRECDHPGEAHPLLPPVPAAAVDAAEAALGFALPPLLRRLYTDVGNGGFGPVYGLIPLSAESFAGDRPREADFDLVGQYRWLLGQTPERLAGTGWRPGLVPAFYCGCTVFEFVDCLAPGGPVVPLDLGSDMDPLPPIPSLADRLGRWLADDEYPW